MAAKETLADKSMTEAEANRMKAPLELDLIAFYNALQEEIIDIIDTGSKEGMSADMIISSVELLFE